MVGQLARLLQALSLLQAACPTNFVIPLRKLLIIYGRLVLHKSRTSVCKVGNNVRVVVVAIPGRRL